LTGDTVILNAVVRNNERGFTLAKQKSRGNIDCAYALMMAFDRAQVKAKTRSRLSCCDAMRHQRCRPSGWHTGAPPGRRNGAEEPAMDENGAALLFGVLTLTAGLIPLAIGIILVMRNLSFLRTAVETTGTIVELRVSPDGEAFQPVVEFKTHEGQTIRWTQFGWRSPPPGNVGDEIPMKYNAQNPNRARIAKVSQMWLVGGMLSLMGLVVGAFGLWAILTA
jgi:hypothetical protein